MKSRNLAKIFILIFSLALIIGTVVGITVSAEESTGAMKGATIVHNDKIQIGIYVDATEEEIKNGTVRVEYTWSDEATVKTATYHSAGEDEKENYSLVVTEGVAAYELAKVATFTAKYNDETVGESKTYSVAEFLYAKLYRDGFATSDDEEKAVAADCYEALLAYGAASQIHLDENADKLVTELACVYSSYHNIKTLTINDGASFYFDATATTATITPGFTAATGWSLTGWKVTDSEGNVETYDPDVTEIVVSGTVDLYPMIAQCIDNDPKDHVCDLHGETLTECVDADTNHKCDICGVAMGTHADGDDGNHTCEYCGKDLADLHADGDDSNHNCDVCNKVLCVDSNSDGKCDGCNRMTFEYTVNGAVTLYTYDNLTNKNLVKQDTITTEDTVESYYGYAGRLEADPTDAANQVLQILVNDGKQNSSTSSGVNNISNIRLDPTVVNEGGKIHVVEFDFNLWHFQKKSGTTITDPFSIYAYDAAGNKLGELQHHSSTAKWAGFISFDSITNEATPDLENNYHFGNNDPRTDETEPSDYAMFDAQKWYRFRFIWDESTKALYFDVSFDGGETWYKAFNGSRAIKEAFGTDAAYLQLEFLQCYDMAFIYYFDNISYTVVDTLPTRLETVGNDAVEFPNGR